MAEERAQRRLAAILAADVVGYSRLMRADEAGTLAQLKTLRAELLDPRIAEYGGRVVKTTGDGILIEFPSAVDAVQHAVDVQQEMAQRNATVADDRRMEIRMGINVGDVIVEGDDLFGDGVNVAARLEGLAEPGGICVSGSAYEQVRDKLQTAFEDMGEQQVKNIDRPVQVYRIDIGKQDTSSGDAHSPAADADFLQRPALAVLPFENLGGDPDQAYFADGLTEDIITALSLWRSFPVIARNSTFVYRGEAVKIQEVGRELGARYVLEGSVRRAGDRVRVSAQLIDADTGHHVWAEKFDRQFEDIFDLQDELTQKIAAIVAPELERVEDNRAKVNQPQDLDAWHLVQRGMAFLDEYTKETNLRAREMFGQALELDPNYSRAYSGLALAYARALMSGYEYSREAATEKCMEAARRAVALDSSDAYGHNMLAMACLWARQNKDAVSSLQRAVELNPSYGHARASLGDTLNRIGRTDEGISLMEDGLRLNPDAPNLRHFNAFLARACINARRYEEAVEWARKAILLRSDLAHAHCLMAAALAHLGRSDEARSALHECLLVQPDFFDSAADLSPYEDPAANEHLLDGLRKAGLQEVIEAEDVSLPDKPSIAVLPFDNMSGDPEQEFFVDGLAEDIITALSKIERMRVIARHSTFEYKGQALDLRKIAEELGVRYVLEGSVRRGGDRLRITAQLIDANDGSHLWAERYDRSVEDLFDIQDEITKEIVTSLRVKLTDGEQARVWARGTDNIEAWQYAVGALDVFGPLTPSGYLQARALAERATQLDPDYALAWAMLGWTYWFDGRFGAPEEMEAKFALAAEYADRAMALDDSISYAIGLSLAVSAALGRYEEGVAIARRGINLYPGNADIRVFYGFALTSAGHYVEAVEQNRAAMSLNPFCPNYYRGSLARSLVCLGEFEEALTHLDEILETDPNFVPVFIYRAYIYAETGRTSDARDAVSELRQLVPDMNMSHISRFLLIKDATITQRFIEDIREAGMPE